ncbi:MAG TPA: disulfide bond chaperone, partial [Chthoniobacterales bacterium]
MSESETPLPEGTEVRTYFVRGRNAMLARADVGELFVDYYLHLHDQGLRHDGTPDRMLKDTLVALLLHSASRPWSESVAWTINFQHPLLNVFAASDNRLASIAGNVFTKNVKENQTNLFYSDLVRGTDLPRRSVVTFDGSEVFPAVEEYYAQSEQRPARYFPVGDEDYVFITAQPDCDLEWLAGLDAEAVRTIDQTETLSLLETRRYK